MDPRVKPAGDTSAESNQSGWQMRQPPRENLPPRSGGEVVAVEVHHLAPGRHEILHELLLRVGAGIDLREGAPLRVRAEDQVDAGAGPLDLLGLAVAALVHAVGAGRLPLRAHVEQVDEEVVARSEENTSELQSLRYHVCSILLE